MSTVIFRRGANAAYADAWTQREWQLASTGQPGTATIHLDYSQAAASATYINPAGGSWVEIVSEGGCGKWVGIIDEPQSDIDKLVITAKQPWVLLQGERVMHWESTFRHAVTPGYVAGRVLKEALSGLPWFNTRYLPSDGSDPPLRNYQLNGQDAWSILTDLMERSTSELWIDAETGDVRWMGALAGALQFTTLLVADGNLFNWSYRPSASQRVGEVVVKRDSERYMLADGAGMLARPAQVTITADAGASMYTAARDELTRRAGAQVAISGAVGASLWTIREGMFANVMVPLAGFSGQQHPCRVLARSRSDDSDLMPLTFQVIDGNVGVRVAPPMRAGSTRNAGAKPRGSFAQRVKANERNVFNTWLADH